MLMTIGKTSESVKIQEELLKFSGPDAIIDEFLPKNLARSLKNRLQNKEKSMFAVGIIVGMMVNDGDLEQ